MFKKNFLMVKVLKLKLYYMKKIILKLKKKNSKALVNSGFLLKFYWDFTILYMEKR